MSVLAILAVVAGVVGIAGSVVPGLPGPPLSWIGMLLAYLAKGTNGAGDPMTTKMLVIWLIIKVCRALTHTFSLNRNDNGITVCQIVILAAIGFWIIGFVLIFDIKNNGRMAAAIGIIGAVLGWIFQDRVKGVAAFLHLRRHHLLNIGDWIRVPKLGVDGEIKKVTLTTVTLYNWDTTTSTIPIILVTHVTCHTHGSFLH